MEINVTAVRLAMADAGMNISQLAKKPMFLREQLCAMPAKAVMVLQQRSTSLGRHLA